VKLLTQSSQPMTGRLAKHLSKGTVKSRAGKKPGLIKVFRFLYEHRTRMPRFF